MRLVSCLGICVALVGCSGPYVPEYNDAGGKVVSTPIFGLSDTGKKLGVVAHLSHPFGTNGGVTSLDLSTNNDYYENLERPTAFGVGAQASHGLPHLYIGGQVNYMQGSFPVHLESRYRDMKSLDCQSLFGEDACGEPDQSLEQQRAKLTSADEGKKDFAYVRADVALMFKITNSNLTFLGGGRVGIVQEWGEYETWRKTALDRQLITKKTTPNYFAPVIALEYNTPAGLHFGQQFQFMGHAGGQFTTTLGSGPVRFWLGMGSQTNLSYGVAWIL